MSTEECTKICDFPSELYPTDLQFLPRSGGSLSKHGDLILLTSVDGKFHILSKTGRIERTIEAHKGAILVGQWGHDGASLLTGRFATNHSLEMRTLYTAKLMKTNSH